MAVARYEMVDVPDCCPQMKQRAKGDYVRYADYAALTAEVAALKRDVEAANALLAEARDWLPFNDSTDALPQRINAHIAAARQEAT